MKISLIIPVFNEELILDSLEKLNEFIKKEKDEWEVIFVNDGSTDNTLEKLKDFKPKFYKIISYPLNKGKGFALRTGVRNATGDYVCFIDSDLPYSFQNLKNLLKYLKDFDIVIGSRNLSTNNSKNISFSRRIMGVSSSIISNIFLGYNIRDTQCGMKAFKNNVAKDIFSKQIINGFYFDPEILSIGKKRGYSLKEIEAVVLKNHQSKPSNVKIIRDSINCFLDLLRIKLNHIKGKYEKSNFT